MEFKDLNPLLHNELRLKIMAALDSLDDADFVYLKELTKATAPIQSAASHPRVPKPLGNINAPF